MSKIKVEATVEIGIQELQEILKHKFKHGELANFELVSLTDKTKIRIEPGMDPHDAEYHDDFDGVILKFVKEQWGSKHFEQSSANPANPSPANNQNTTQNFSSE